jgi:hypothetical protein
MRYADGGGLSERGRAKREAVRLQAAEWFAQDVPVAEIARRLRVSCTARKVIAVRQTTCRSSLMHRRQPGTWRRNADKTASTARAPAPQTPSPAARSPTGPIPAPGPAHCSTPASSGPHHGPQLHRLTCSDDFSSGRRSQLSSTTPCSTRRWSMNPCRTTSAGYGTHCEVVWTRSDVVLDELSRGLVLVVKIPADDNNADLAGTGLSQSNGE